MDPSEDSCSALMEAPTRSAAVVGTEDFEPLAESTMMAAPKGKNDAVSAAADDDDLDVSFLMFEAKGCFQCLLITWLCLAALLETSKETWKASSPTIFN